MTTGFNDPTAQRLERIATGAEPDVVGPLLAEALHDDRWRECDVALISGGKSNLTYRVSSDAGEVVLRRPPLGHILPTAHDMAREHRVLSALEGTAVPVPRTFHLGTHRRRHVLRDGARARARLPQRAARRATPSGRSSAARSARRSSTCSPTCTRSTRQPSGWPSSGARPATWSASCGAGRSSGRRPRSPRTPALDRVLADLRRRLPSERAGSIVHGDYRLDNTVLHPTRPGAIVAVLDWEMSTLGDPLTDLGALLAFWSEAGDDDVLHGGADRAAGDRRGRASRPARR